MPCTTTHATPYRDGTCSELIPAQRTRAVPPAGTREGRSRALRITPPDNADPPKTGWKSFQLPTCQTLTVLIYGESNRPRALTFTLLQG